MKVCSHCKTQNNDSANYCRQCGFVFPDVNLRSGKIDNSLIDKVNELQKRISDAEANANNSQREINTLNSRVSSLVNSNSSSSLALRESTFFIIFKLLFLSLVAVRGTCPFSKFPTL